eukprot:TRINITY_DN452_c0_g1_i1.p1 TRINITY_DN452_c0_g1~~TRINITY_DN452_c0_g1_i1.p1  ORF type:complete len:377 (-),score=85.96 TRINITY_DN452_c0_g1_i1:1056-2186(-)
MKMSGYDSGSAGSRPPVDDDDDISLPDYSTMVLPHSGRNPPAAATPSHPPPPKAALLSSPSIATPPRQSSVPTTSTTTSAPRSVAAAPVSLSSASSPASQPRRVPGAGVADSDDDAADDLSAVPDFSAMSIPQSGRAGRGITTTAVLTAVASTAQSVHTDDTLPLSALLALPPLIPSSTKPPLRKRPARKKTPRRSDSDSEDSIPDYSQWDNVPKSGSQMPPRRAVVKKEPRAKDPAAMSFDEWQAWQRTQPTRRARSEADEAAFQLPPFLQARAPDRTTMPSADMSGVPRSAVAAMDADMDVNEYLSLLQRVQGVDLGQSDFVRLVQPLSEARQRAPPRPLEEVRTEEQHFRFLQWMFPLCKLPKDQQTQEPNRG